MKERVYLVRPRKVEGRSKVDELEMVHQKFKVLRERVLWLVDGEQSRTDYKNE